MVSATRLLIILGICIGVLRGQSARASSVYISCDEQGNLKSAKTVGGAFNYSSKQEDIQLLRESMVETCQGVTGCFANLKQLRSDLGNGTAAIERFAINLSRNASRRSQREDLLGDLHRLQDTLSSCEYLRAQASDSPSKDHIALSYPFKGPNQSKTGSHYDRARIERAVRLALLNGVDPNLALGILLTENAPVDSKQSEEYSEKFGLLPINAIPAYEYLGCLAPKSKAGSYRYASSADAVAYLNASRPRLALEKEQSALGDRMSASLLKLDPVKGEDRNSWDKLYLEKCKHPILTLHTKICSSLHKYLEYATKIEQENSRINKISSQFGGGDPVQSELARRELSCGSDCGAYLVPQKAIPAFEVRTDNGPVSQVKLCTADRTVKYNSHPAFDSESRSQSPVSCCTYVHASKKSDLKSVAEDTKSALALKFMNEKIHSRQDPSLSISHLIQTYNGTGCVGCTEKLKSSCLNGLNMGKTPVYGAKVADLMVNSIMNNPEIQSIIRHAAAEFNAPVRSLFCERLGKGSHSIPSDVFYREQRRYLLEKEPGRRAACAPLFK